MHTYADGRVLWVSTDDPTAQADRQFGHGTRVYNVIDSRQSYLQDVVVAGLRALGFNEQADRSVHFSYEMVALSPRCCADLGIPLSEEDRKKPYVEVSGRKGLGVKADDLMDSLIAKALEEVKSRHPGRPGGSQPAGRHADRHRGAARYLLKFTRNTVIAFDLQEALAFVGETGPYVQYTAVRAARLVAGNKLAERGESIPDFCGGAERGSHGPAVRERGFLADAAGSVESRCRGRGCRGSGRAGPCGALCVSTGADFQQLSTRNSPSCTRRIARRRFSCCG